MPRGDGSVRVLSSAEPKYLTEKWIRLISLISRVLGRETWVFDGFGTKAVLCFGTTNLPPEGGDLPKVVLGRRRGEPLLRGNYSFGCLKETETPVGKARRPLVGRPEPGGGRGETEVNRPAPGGGRRTTTEPQQTAFESLGAWDSPPGRHAIYHDLDAREGQSHV